MYGLIKKSLDYLLCKPILWYLLRKLNAFEIIQSKKDTKYFTRCCWRVCDPKNKLAWEIGKNRFLKCSWFIIVETNDIYIYRFQRVKKSKSSQTKSSEPKMQVPTAKLERRLQRFQKCAFLRKPWRSKYIFEFVIMIISKLYADFIFKIMASFCRRIWQFRWVPIPNETSKSHNGLTSPCQKQSDVLCSKVSS